MEVRNTLLAALVIEVLAVAAHVAPGAGALTSVAVGIATCMSVALVLLALVSWRLSAAYLAAAELNALAVSAEEASVEEPRVSHLAQQVPAAHGPAPTHTDQPAILAG